MLAIYFADALDRAKLYRFLRQSDVLFRFGLLINKGVIAIVRFFEDIRGRFGAQAADDAGVVTEVASGNILRGSRFVVCHNRKVKLLVARPSLRLSYS